MIANIRDNIWIYLDQVTQGVEEVLVKEFSAKHPRSYYIDTRGSWDGVYRRYSVAKQRLALPFKLELIEVCKKHKIPLEINDERLAPKYPSPNIQHITEDFIEGIKLESWQIKALHAACKHEIGIIDSVTGSGKTEIACGIVKMYRCPTLIITEQIVVLEQIVDRLKLRNVVHNDDIGQFCHGKMPNGNIVLVGSIQSINTPKPPPRKPKKPTVAQAKREGIKLAEAKELPNYFPKKLKESLYENPSAVKKLDGRYLDALVSYVGKLFHERLKHWYKVRKKNSDVIQEAASKCDLLIVDECDKAVSDAYKKLFTKIFKGRRRYGFSGTPFNSAKPHLNLFLRERLGNIISKADRKEVTKAGRIIPIKYIMIAYGQDGDKQDSTALDIAEREYMIEDPKFHNTILKLVSSFPNDRTLILVDTLSIQELGHSLEGLIPNSEFIYGKTSKPKRRKVLKAFEDGEISTLIGGKILKRGLDLKGGVDNLILCGGGKDVTNIDQIIGRAVRKNERGYARVFDFLFLNNKYFYRHSRSRLKAVVDMGYETKVIVSGREIDGEKFVKSRFRIPKKK